MSIVVVANMSREVYEYYKEYDLSRVVNTLMEMYDFTNLPAITGPREVERKITVTNEMYISLYKSLGARSKKLSIGRLLEFGYNMDVLALPRFEEMRGSMTDDNPTYHLVDRAFRALSEARKYDDSAELKEITNLVYTYREVIR